MPCHTFDYDNLGRAKPDTQVFRSTEIVSTGYLTLVWTGAYQPPEANPTAAPLNGLVAFDGGQDGRREAITDRPAEPVAALQFALQAWPERAAP
jgi:hypothetical protein